MITGKKIAKSDNVCQLPDSSTRAAVCLTQKMGIKKRPE